MRSTSAWLPSTTNRNRKAPTRAGEATFLTITNNKSAV